MIIQRQPRGRVYTYPEVKALVDEAKRLTSESIAKNRATLDKALAADHEKAMLVMCLRALQLDGFQKNPMERMMGRIADMTDQLDAEELDWERDILNPVEDCLGYKIEADGLLEQLAEEIQ